VGLSANLSLFLELKSVEKDNKAIEYLNILSKSLFDLISSWPIQNQIQVKYEHTFEEARHTLPFPEP
jgi:hypothetical protein